MALPNLPTRLFSWAALTCGVVAGLLFASRAIAADQPSALAFQPLVKQSTPSYSSDAAVAYLDSLSSCSPNSQLMPLPLLEGFITNTTIQGWQSNRCVVATQVWFYEAPQQQSVMSICRYRPETLAFMTDAIAYEQARTGNYSFDSSNQRDMALSNAMTEDCEFNMNWLDELLPWDEPLKTR